MIILNFIAGVVFVILCCSGIVTVAYGLTVALFTIAFKIILRVEEWLDKRRH